MRVIFANSIISSIVQFLRREKPIVNEKDLVSFINEIDSKHKVIDDDAISHLHKFYYKLPKHALSRDPFSEDYIKSQLQIYRDLSGTTGEYSCSNEITNHDFAPYRYNPFPYCTGSSKLVGEMLGSYGFAIKAMNLKPGSKIVEFGTGWGNITYQLAMSGYNVTAVDVSPELLRLLRERIEGHNGKAVFVQSDMCEFAQSCTEEYDAALFTESFHHCINHVELIRQLSRIVPSGIIAFVREPIFPAKNPYLPYPWGIRLDGQSVYFIRKLSWLELGYQYGYLKKLLLRFGWNLRRYDNPDKEVPCVYIARRKTRN